MTLVNGWFVQAVGRGGTLEGVATTAVPFCAVSLKWDHADACFMLRGGVRKSRGSSHRHTQGWKKPRFFATRLVHSGAPKPSTHHVPLRSPARGASSGALLCDAAALQRSQRASWDPCALVPHQSPRVHLGGALSHFASACLFLDIRLYVSLSVLPALP